MRLLFLFIVLVAARPLDAQRASIGIEYVDPALSKNRTAWDDVLAYGVLVPASFAVLESWAQRAVVVLLTVCMGEMPAPVAFAAAVAMAAHNLWVSPRFLVAVIAALAAATGVLTLVLPRNDLGWTVVVATAVVHFHRFLPPIHRQWAPLAFVVFVAAPAVVIIGPGVGVFVLLYAVVTRTPLGRYFDDFARRFE